MQKEATLGAVLHQRAESQALSCALIHNERRTSYEELNRHASQIANGLAALGVNRGQRVAFLGKNSDLYFELLLGAARAGVTTVPLNWRLATPEIAAILADAHISMLFLGLGFAGMLPALALREDLPRVAMDGADPALPDFAAWREAQPDTSPPSRADAEDTLLLMYTSGTTGLPKGVELTHRNVLYLLASGREGGALAFGPDDRVIICMPVAHVSGTNVGLGAIIYGSTTVVMAEFDPARLVDLIPRHRATWVLLVPAALRLVVQHPAAASGDFRSLQTMAYGASPIAEALIEQARVTFPAASLWQLYGLTEASGGGTILDPASHDPARNKLRSCGKPYPGFELRIVDLDGIDVPTGEVGEIVLRTPGVMKGYWRNPAATAAAFFPGDWLRTGDAAHIDSEGYVYIYDRVKDMIVSGGENIFPAEVENALYGHPAIADVAVIGVPDERWGEAVKALVVLKPDADANEADVIAHARTRIAGFKVPKSVEFLNALPRNAAGKLLRRKLREPYWEGRDRRVS